MEGKYKIIDPKLLAESRERIKKEMKPKIEEFKRKMSGNKSKNMKNKEDILKIFNEHLFRTKDLDGDWIEFISKDDFEIIVDRILEGCQPKSNEENFICDHCDTGFDDMSKEVVLDIECYNKLIDKNK